MPIPIRQNLKIGAYLMRQRLAGRDKFPLIVELEPLFVCNLACPGCGKIQYPTDILRKRLSVEDAVGAIEECGAPMVSIAAKASSGVRRCRRISVGYWILPQPGHARLQAKSGSSSTMSGYLSTLRILFFARYAAMRRFWRRGIATGDYTSKGGRCSTLPGSQVTRALAARTIEASATAAA